MSGLSFHECLRPKRNGKVFHMGIDLSYISHEGDMNKFSWKKSAFDYRKPRTLFTIPTHGLFIVVKLCNMPAASSAMDNYIF